MKTMNGTNGAFVVLLVVLVLALVLDFSASAATGTSFNVTTRRYVTRDQVPGVDSFHLRFADGSSAVVSTWHGSAVGKWLREHEGRAVLSLEAK